MATKKKKITLRAFDVENLNITKSESDVKDLLLHRLEETNAGDRLMLLNERVNDQDLICNYDSSNKRFLWGSMLRICPSEEVLNIPDDLLQENKIELQELDSLQGQGDLMYKSHYYFLLTNKYLITTFPRDVTIHPFQTYVNWFLEELRGTEMFEFNPKIRPAPIL